MKILWDGLDIAKSNTVEMANDADTHATSSYLSSYLWYTFESGHLTLVSGAGEGEVVSVIHARHAKDQMRGRPDETKRLNVYARLDFLNSRKQLSCAFN